VLELAAHLVHNAAVVQKVAAEHQAVLWAVPAGKFAQATDSNSNSRQ
jgi:hypothetical protein